MQNVINVREILGVEPKRPPLFFDPIGPDRYAAMDRKRIFEQRFEQIYREINQTNTRGIPKDLIELYEKWTVLSCQIINEEEKIIKGRTE